MMWFFHMLKLRFLSLKTPVFFEVLNGTQLPVLNVLAEHCPEQCSQPWQGQMQGHRVYPFGALLDKPLSSSSAFRAYPARGGEEMEDGLPEVPTRLNCSGSNISSPGTIRWLKIIRLADFTSYCLPDEVQFLTGCGFWFSSSQKLLLWSPQKGIFHLPESTQSCQLNCLPSPEPVQTKCHLPQNGPILL